MKTTLTIAFTGAIALALAQAACSKDKSEPAKSDDDTSKTADKPADPAGAKAGDTDKTKPAKPDPAPDKAKVEKASPLPGTEKPEVMCGDNGILLTKWSFQELADGKYCEQCKKFDENACDLDWPSSDVMECSEYDVMRNGIYAAYGNSFSKKKWQEHFGKKSWYKAGGKVDELALPVVAQKNIKFLKDGKAKCLKAEGL